MRAGAMQLLLTLSVCVLQWRDTLHCWPCLLQACSGAQLGHVVCSWQHQSLCSHASLPLSGTLSRHSLLCLCVVCCV